MRIALPAGAAAGLLLVTALGGVGLPQAMAEFPERPITYIVPWAPGGSTDQVTRVLARAAEARLGQPIVVVNKPGASTAIGMGEVAAAKPDGYTLGTMSSTSYLVALQGRALPFDPIDGFSYVSYIGENLIGIAVRADSPWQTLADLVAEGRKRRLTFGTGGVGSTQHLTAEALKAATGANFVHVPQQGSAGSMPALLGRHVDFIAEVSVWAPFVESGEVRLLAVATPKRSAAYPKVPPLAESGVQSLRSVQAIVAPKGLPEPIRMRLETAFRQSLSDPAFIEAMRRLRMEIIDLSGSEVRAMLDQEYARGRELIAQSRKPGG